ncbi:MAG: hypothetical protein ACREPR_14995 [Brasilonema sp.]
MIEDINAKIEELRQQKAWIDLQIAGLKYARSVVLVRETIELNKDLEEFNQVNDELEELEEEEYEGI